MVMQIVTIGGGKHVLVDWLSSFDSGHHFARWVRIVAIAIAIAIVNATGARSKKSRTPI
jgi:hypothetical protein